MKRRLIGTGALCRLLQIPLTTLHSWMDKGVLKPSFDVERRHKAFAILPDVLSAAVGLGLRASGYEFEQAARMMKFVQSLSAECIESDFAAGRTLAVMLGPIVVERLSAPDEVSESKVLAALVAKTGIKPTVVDVRRVYENILAKLEAEPEREPVSAG